jgi:hypothetical protein
VYIRTQSPVSVPAKHASVLGTQDQPQADILPAAAAPLAAGTDILVALTAGYFYTCKLAVVVVVVRKPMFAVPRILSVALQLRFVASKRRFFVDVAAVAAPLRMPAAVAVLAFVLQASVHAVLAELLLQSSEISALRHLRELEPPRGVLPAVYVCMHVRMLLVLIRA